MKTWCRVVVTALSVLLLGTSALFVHEQLQTSPYPSGVLFVAPHLSPPKAWAAQYMLRPGAVMKLLRRVGFNTTVYAQSCPAYICNGFVPSEATFHCGETCWERPCAPTGQNLNTYCDRVPISGCDGCSDAQEYACTNPPQ